MKNQEEINVEKLKQLIIKGSNFIKEQIDKAIIVIGSTGSGKSTLINALVGKQLITKTNPFDHNKAVIELVEGIKGLQIGHNSAISETSVPEYIVDDNKKVGYFDCPGFGDTKSNEQEIANFIFIKRIFENVKNVKIVVVAQQQEFNSTVGRGALIINFINKLINLFPGIDDLIQSICLIVTKVEATFNNRTKQVYETSIELILEKLSDFKNLHLNSYNELSGNFLNSTFLKVFDTFFIKDRVEIFNSPIGNDGQIINFPQKIYNLIDQLPYIKSPIINSSITPQIKLYLQKFYIKLHEKGQEQAQQLKDQLTKFLYKSQDFQIVLLIIIQVNKLLNLKQFFEVINPNDILDITKIQYKTRRKEFEEFIELNNKNNVDILQLIEFIGIAQLPSLKISDFLFREIENINNDAFKLINNQKDNLIERFYQITHVIKNSIQEYLQNIQDENQLNNFLVELEESQKDEIQYLQKYREIILKNISITNIKELLNELILIKNYLKQIFNTIIQQTNESLGQFPNNLLLKQLQFSFIDIKLKLQELKQINLEKTNQLIIKQKEIDLNSQLETKFNLIDQQQQQFQEEQIKQNLEKIEFVKKEEEIKENQLKEEMERQAKEIESRKEKEKKEYEEKIAELKQKQELDAIRQKQEEEERQKTLKELEIKKAQIQAQVNAQKKKRKRKFRFLKFHF